MSVSLLIDNPINNQDRIFELPIASESTFSNYWLTASSDLGLNLISEFSICLSVEKNNYGELLKELDIFAKWISEKSDYAPVLREAILDRINILQSTLRTLFKARPDVTVTIG